MDKVALVVDDDDDIRYLLTLALGALGFCEVIEAENGQEALRIFQLRKFDLVTSDLTMPRMNGSEFIRAIKKSHMGLILLITGRSEEAKQLAELVDGIVIKPFKLKDITHELRRMGIIQ